MEKQRDNKGRFVKGNTKGHRFKSDEETSEYGRMGGMASGVSKRNAKTFAEALRRVLDEPASAGSDKTRREVVSEKAIVNLFNNPTMKDLKIAAELMGELEQNINLNHNMAEKPVINIVPRKSDK